MAWSEDTAGVKPKPAPTGFSIDINHYSAAADWLKKYVLSNYGLEITEVLHDVYSNLWRCYDSNKEIVINVDHDLMQRLALVLEQIDWLWAERRQQDDIDEQLRYDHDEGEHNGYE